MALTCCDGTLHYLFFGGMVSCLVTAEAVNSRSHNISSIKLYLLKLTNRTLQFDLEVAFLCVYLVN